MTIDKAIEILKLHQEPTEWDLYDDDVDAIKLGSEALKWRKLMEKDYGSWCGPPLPGETEE